MKTIKKLPTFFHEFGGRPIPAVDNSSYRLLVEGAVKHRLKLTLTELEFRLPVVECQRRFYCVNGWSLQAVWRGFELCDLLNLAEPESDAIFLRAISIGGYEDTSVARELVHRGAILATHMDGVPLSLERGAPIRLLVFDRYQFRGVKSVVRLDLTREYCPGSWVRYGYSDASVQPFPHLALDTGEELMPEDDVLNAPIDQP